MLRFEQHYSSSKGNLYTVTAANGRRLLLECGVRWQLVQQALEYKLDSIDGCLLTHEHKDHGKAIVQVMRAGIDVYASQGTLDALNADDTYRAKPVKEDVVFEISNTFQAIPFKVHHDAAQPFGYVIREVETDEYLYFSLDSSHLVNRFDYAFDIIAIELSYERERLEWMLDTGNINAALAKRLLTSHAEKQTIIDYLDKFCTLYKCRELHLLHTSAGNLDRPKAKRDFEKKFFIKTVIKGIN